MIVCDMKDCIFISEDKIKCDKEDIGITMNMNDEPVCLDYMTE